MAGTLLLSASRFQGPTCSAESEGQREESVMTAARGVNFMADEETPRRAEFSVFFEALVSTQTKPPPLVTPGTRDGGC
jgi:hypothetical protein